MFADSGRHGRDVDGHVRVVVAPDKFKGTLSSGAVAGALRDGLMTARPSPEVVCVPVADGGDGSLEVALSFGAARLDVTVTDALYRPARASIALDGERATIEVAQICGLGDRKPDGAAALAADSSGVGQAVRAALDAGAKMIVLAVGGTATTDGGAGMMRALGARLTDRSGNDLPPGGGPLGDLAAVDFSTLDPRLATVSFVLASDVDNPLLGPTGAALVYSRQKGAGPSQARLLDAALARWADLAEGGLARGGWTGPTWPGAKTGQLGSASSAAISTRPGAGAGGGLGFGAFLLGAALHSGADYFLDMAGFDDTVRAADLVITGEGRLDPQSLHGKAPIVVAQRARQAGARVRAVVGTCLLPPDRWPQAGLDAVDALADIDPACADDAALSRQLLTQIGRRIGVGLAAGSRPQSLSPN